MQLYPDPALRPTSDLDLLIQKHHLLRADEILSRIGYRRAPDAHSWEFDVTYDQATFYTHDEMLAVDLHWELLSNPIFASVARIELDGVWKRSVVVKFGGEPVLALCPEDLLIYLALHLAIHHAYSGLIWQLDIVLLLERYGNELDWNTVVERARQWRVTKALFFVLETVRESFSHSASDTILAELRPRDLRGYTMSWLLRHRDRERLRQLDHLIPLLLVDRGGDLIAPLRDAILPSASWLRVRYDEKEASLWRCYGRHLRRLRNVVGRLLDGVTPRRLKRDGF